MQKNNKKVQKHKMKGYRKTSFSVYFFFYGDLSSVFLLTLIFGSVFWTLITYLRTVINTFHISPHLCLLFLLTELTLNNCL